MTTGNEIHTERQISKFWSSARNTPELDALLRRWARLVRRKLPGGSTLSAEEVNALSLAVLFRLDLVWPNLASDGGTVSRIPKDRFNWTDLAFAVLQAAVAERVRRGQDDAEMQRLPPVDFPNRKGHASVTVDGATAALVEAGFAGFEGALAQRTQARNMREKERRRQFRMSVRELVLAACIGPVDDIESQDDEMLDYVETSLFLIRTGLEDLYAEVSEAFIPELLEELAKMFRNEKNSGNFTQRAFDNIVADD